jgi:serine/threonine-protein kinase
VVYDLAPGPKTIKVLSSDIATQAPVTESVEAGKERMVLITVESAVAGTGFKATSEQQNIKVFVDGSEKGTLPAELKDLTAGSHKVRFDGGERFEKHEQTVEVAASQMKDLGAIKLKVIKGQATIEVVTKGASVTLVRELRGKKITKKVPDGSGAIKLDIDPSEGWKLVATKRGFQDFIADLSFADGQAEKSIRIELAEEGKVAATPPAPAAPAAPAPAPVAAAPPPAAAATAAADKQPAASGAGTLNMNSIPVSKVVLDGKPLGSTPKVGVSVPAGTHSVTFIHPDLGKKSVSVQIKSGETKTAAVKFDKKE